MELKKILGILSQNVVKPYQKTQDSILIDPTVLQNFWNFFFLKKKKPSN